MPNMSFALIDAKDSGIVEVDGERQPKNKTNVEVLANAYAEYLNKLLYIQQKIKAKYGPQLINNKVSPNEGTLYEDGGLDEIFYKITKKLLNEGTDHLHYS